MTRKSILHSKVFLLFFVLMMIMPFIAISPPFIPSSIEYTSDDLSTANSIPKFNSSALPQIDYKALNQSWYSNNLDMLIIVPNGSESFRSAVEPLAKWKNQKGVNTLILSNYSKYPGADGPEKIRNMIKSYYESDSIRWVLLAGDAQNDSIPIRYVHNWDTRKVVDDDEKVGDFSTQEKNNKYKPTDYYYADLTGTWDSDGDKIYGEAPEYNSYGEDEINWTPEVYVGRLPADSESELNNMVQKTLEYEKNPKKTERMNKMLLAGGVSDMQSSNDPDGEDESILTSYISQHYVLNRMNFTHLAHDDLNNPPDPWEELTRAKFRSEFNKGYSTVIYAGHGGFKRTFPYENIYNERIEGTIYEESDADSCSNEDIPSLIYADACVTSCYDIDTGTKGKDNSIGETLIKESLGGAVGYVGAMRLSLYFPNDEDLEMLNRGNAKLFWKVFFEDNTYQQGKTLYDSKVAYMESSYYKNERPPSSFSGTAEEWEQADRKQLLTYNLLGDPEVDIYTNVSGKVSNNPFPSEVYEGQMVELNIRDNYSRPVENPRVYLYNDERGVARTVYGDETGNVKFRLPLGEGITYNVSISGHNLAGLSNFSFTTLPDNETPSIKDVDLSPTPTFFGTTLDFEINTTDDASGIESVFIMFSTNNFESFTYHQVRNEFEENESYFDLKLSSLNECTYKYLVYVRDYSNKTDTLYQSSFQFNIPIPIGFYVVLGCGIGLISASVIATVYYVRKAARDRLDETLEPEG